MKKYHIIAECCHCRLTDSTCMINHKNWDSPCLLCANWRCFQSLSTSSGCSQTITLQPNPSLLVFYGVGKSLRGFMLSLLFIVRHKERLCPSAFGEVTGLFCFSHLAAKVSNVTPAAIAKINTITSLDILAVDSNSGFTFLDICTN